MTSSTSSPTFTHLRVHSEYSIVDGLVRIDDLVAAAAKDKQAALAITDLANLFGMVKFYNAARGKGVKPIIGVDAWISNDDNRDRQRGKQLRKTRPTSRLRVRRPQGRARERRTRRASP